MSQQNPIIPTATQAKGIDAVVNDLQTHLSFELSWLTNGMGRAYRRNKSRSNGSSQFLPMVYLGTNKYNFFNATPDNDKEGQSIILVGDATHTQYQTGFYGWLEYPISIIFSANLDTIDSALLATEDFTEHLMEDVREALVRDLIGKAYRLEITNETREFEDVYSEFDIAIGTTNKQLLPMTYFRFDCTLTVKEDCAGVSLNRCQAIQNNLTPDDITNCIIPNYCGGGYANSYSMYFDGTGEVINYPINAAYDLEYTDSFTFTARIKIDSWHLGAILGKYVNNGFGWFWRVSTNGRLQIFFGRGSSQRMWVETTNTLTIGQTYHVAMCFGGAGAASVDQYLNAVLETPIVLQDNITGSIINGNNLVSGSIVGGNYFHGTQNVVRIWKGIKFNQSQVSADYNGNVPTDAGEVGFLVLDNKMGDGGVFGVDTWCLPDESGTVTGGQSDFMEFNSRVAAI